MLNLNIDHQKTESLTLFIIYVVFFLFCHTSLYYIYILKQALLLLNIFSRRFLEGLINAEFKRITIKILKFNLRNLSPFLISI